MEQHEQLEADLLAEFEPRQEFVDSEADLSEQSDEVEQSDHDTESLQSEIDVAEFDDNGDAVPVNAPVDPLHFVGRDGTLWNMNPPRHQPPLQRILHLPAVTTIGRRAQTILASWRLLFTPRMIGEIVNFTNQKIAEIRQKFSRERDAADTDAVELHAFIGLLYMAGIHKSSHTNLNDLWLTDGTGIEFFRLIMSCRRFRFLLRALCFDNSVTRQQFRPMDCLAAIRDYFTSFVQNCQVTYTPGQFVTIDEMLVPFRGRCGFRQYIPSKPARYGIKIHSLACPRSFYTVNMEIYAGCQPKGQYQLNNQGYAVIQRLIQPIVQSGRTVTIDNWYSSFETAAVLTDNGLTMLDTVRKNKRFIPPLFLSRIRERPAQSRIFGFSNHGTLLSYAAKKSKFVIILSTIPEHQVPLIYPNDDRNRPDAIITYNKNKGGVDQVDRQVGFYSVSRGTCRWPMAVFFSTLNVGGINSFIIYKKNTGNHLHRREYLKELAKQLVYDHARRRLSQVQLNAAIRAKLRNLFPTRQNEIYPDIPAEERDEDKCYLCPSRMNRKSKTFCERCNRAICKTDHTITFCPDCT